MVLVLWELTHSFLKRKGASIKLPQKLYLTLLGLRHYISSSPVMTLICTTMRYHDDCPSRVVGKSAEVRNFVKRQEKSRYTHKQLERNAVVLHALQERAHLSCTLRNRARRFNNLTVERVGSAEASRLVSVLKNWDDQIRAIPREKRHIQLDASLSLIQPFKNLASHFVSWDPNLFIAKDHHGHIRGVMEIQLNRLASAVRVGWLLSDPKKWLDPEHSVRGAGTQLIITAARVAQMCGYDKISLTSCQSATSFYENLHFREEKWVLFLPKEEFSQLPQHLAAKKRTLHETDITQEVKLEPSKQPRLQST